MSAPNPSFINTKMRNTVVHALRPLVFVLSGAFAMHPALAQSPALKASAAKPAPLEVSKTIAGTMKLELGAGVVLNSGSTLKTEAYVLNDPESPVRIDGPSPVSVIYKPGSRTSSGSYEYSGYLDLKVKEPVVALEYRAHVFDVFGRPVKTLVGTEIADVNSSKVLFPAWRIYTENEASEHQLSVIYINMVRTASGSIYRIDRNRVLEAVQKISSQVSAADLEPPKRKSEP